MTQSPNLRSVLSRSDILSTASSVIASYPSITSAYLFGSYAKGTAHPDSDVDIAIFHADLSWDKIRQEIGGVHMYLEGALNKQVDLSVCPPDDFVEKIRRYWVPINVGTQKSSSLLSSSSTDATHPPVVLPIMSSDEKKERLQFMERTCKDLIKYINDVNYIGGVSMLNDLLEHAISDCVDRLGRSIKNRDLEFDTELQKTWSDLRDIPWYELDLSSIWDALFVMAQRLFVTIQLKLAGNE